MSEAYILPNKIKQIIADKIHAAKSKIHDKLPKGVWMALPSDEMGDACAKEIIQLLEAYMFIPCCHTSGMHSPTHFADRKGICESQKAEAFIRFAKDLGVNPETKSKIDCGWCADYKEYRRGEGVKLFTKKGLEASNG